MTTGEDKKVKEDRVPLIVEHDRRYNALLARKPVRDWTSADMRHLWYSVADIAIICARRANAPPDWAPHKLSAKALNVNLIYFNQLKDWPRDASRTWEAVFPVFFEEWSVDGRINFPSPDHKGKVSANLFMHRMIENWINTPDDYDPANFAKFGWLVNNQLVAEGKMPWRYVLLYQLERKAQKALYAEHERQESKGGRGPSAQTWSVKKIMETLNIGQRHAYRILEQGTALLYQRKRLAVAFADDPSRNLPVYWDLRSGRRGRGRPTAFSLRTYCVSWVDAHEEWSGTLAALRNAYELGVLADHYKSLPELIAGLEAEKIAIQASEALGVWSSFQKWRQDQLSNQAKISFLSEYNNSRSP